MANELSGLRELDRKLGQIGAKSGGKALRSAVLKATTPVLRQMRQKVPVGTEAHRTYKKRLVSPGFASRSLRRKTRFDAASGKASVVIGVRSEAFYAIQFYDQGPYTISQRRMGKGKGKRAIKPYTLPKRPWFQSTFVANRATMEKKMAEELRVNIEKVARGN